LREAEQKLALYLESLAARQKVAVSTRSLAQFEPVPFPAEMVSLVETTARELDFPCRRLASGAGHDAQMMARVCPSGMIFVPSVDGLSHNVREYTKPDHLEAGVAVLMHVFQVSHQSSYRWDHCVAATSTLSGGIPMRWGL
jgi:beta-ureidopropionase / N-carbamoyl-L-amino-acid hydrolase